MTALAPFADLQPPTPPNPFWSDFMWTTHVEPLVRHPHRWLKHISRLLLVAGCLVAFLLCSAVVVALLTSSATRAQACAAQLTSRHHGPKRPLRSGRRRTSRRPAFDRGLAAWVLASCTAPAPRVQGAAA